MKAKETLNQNIFLSQMASVMASCGAMGMSCATSAFDNAHGQKLKGIHTSISGWVPPDDKPVRQTIVYVSMVVYYSLHMLLVGFGVSCLFSLSSWVVSLGVLGGHFIACTLIRLLINKGDLYEEDEMLDLSELELASASDIAIDIRNKEGEEEEEEDETLEENDENTNIEDDVFGGRVAVSSSTRIVMTTPSKHNKKDAKGNNNNAIDMKKNGPTPRQQQEHSVMKDREERGEGNGSIILNKHGQPVSPRSYSKKVLRAERRARKRAVMAAFRRPRNEINDVNEDLLAGQLRLGSRGTTGGTSTFARRDVYVLEIDDETDEDIMSVLLDRDIPRGLSFFSTERVSCLVQWFLSLV
eukprot:g3427.t1